MKKITFVITLGLLGLFTINGQTIVKESGSLPITTDPVFDGNSTMGACLGVLPDYENVTPAGDGGPSQSFEPANAAFDSEMADDFVVPGSGQAIVCEVSIVGSYTAVPSNPGNLVLVRIYDDNGGMPDNELFFDFIPLSVADPSLTGNITVALSGAPALMGGTKYWISLQLDMDFTPEGQFFWSTATDGNDDPYVFQNPGDGFATGCTAWTSGQVCGIAGGTGPDLLMSISFNEALSIDDINLNQAVVLYPNPATDIINVRVNSGVEIINASLFDLLGKNTGVSLSNGTVDVSNLSRGVYMLTVNTNSGSITKKIVKK